MIVNLESKTINRISEFKYEIIFDLPKLYFDPTQTVYANEVAIHWKSKTNSTALLQTTLIDKSPLNTSQQLLFIFQRKESNFLYYSPTRIQEYKIQRAELQSSQFYLETSEKTNILKIYLQLHFSDARIQQINKK